MIIKLFMFLNKKRKKKRNINYLSSSYQSLFYFFSVIPCCSKISDFYHQETKKKIIRLIAVNTTNTHILSTIPLPTNTVMDIIIIIHNHSHRSSLIWIDIMRLIPVFLLRLFLLISFRQTKRKCCRYLFTTFFSKKKTNSKFQSRIGRSIKADKYFGRKKSGNKKFGC